MKIIFNILFQIRNELNCSCFFVAFQEYVAVVVYFKYKAFFICKK